jgi:hypothetical protein
VRLSSILFSPGTLRRILTIRGGHLVEKELREFFLLKITLLSMLAPSLKEFLCWLWWVLRIHTLLFLIAWFLKSIKIHLLLIWVKQLINFEKFSSFCVLLFYFGNFVVMHIKKVSFSLQFCKIRWLLHFGSFFNVFNVEFVNFLKEFGFCVGVPERIVNITERVAKLRKRMIFV